MISVGAWEDRNYFLTPAFSRFTKEDPLQPDLWAPGDDFVSVLSPNYDFSLPNRSRENIVGSHYIRMSGACLAAPFVSGAAALLLERYPNARPREFKNHLLQLTLPTEGLLTRELI